MNIKVLRQKRADLVKEAQGVFDVATTENRGLTEAEAARDDAISAELTDIDAQIGRAERQMERQRSIGANADANSDADQRDRGGRGGEQRFATLGEQMMAVARAGNPDYRGAADSRLIIAGPTGLSEGIAADGGFMVQTDFNNELLQNTYESGEIASRVRRIGIGPNSNGINMNGVDETSRANGSRWGGILSYWTGEAQLKTASQPKFRRIKMELDKLTGLCYATDELLQDSTALESWLRQAFADEFVFRIEDAIMNGNGSGMPLGFLNGGSTITVNKETSQVAATIVAENILKMWARMPARSRKNAVWLVNQDVEPQLYQFNIKIKNVAGTENVGGIATPQVIFTPPGANGNQYATLMGRPVIPVEYAATLGTAGDIVLADLSQYLAIDKGPAQVASSIHVRFIYDETAFRFVYRFNGQPIWAAPMTPFKGSATQSPFIALQTR
ncbi:phage major capsid protein [Mesorhizobium sp. M6A.T.Ca.TU.002.02.2.1]|nr:phage major capsid protein [Mesorhizobium sp. M6A.T.Ca.TU.002.02.2.1]